MSRTILKAIRLKLLLPEREVLSHERHGIVANEISGWVLVDVKKNAPLRKSDLTDTQKRGPLGNQTLPVWLPWIGQGG